MNELIIEFLDSTCGHKPCNLEQKTAACRLRLIRHDIAASADPMPHVEMSFLNHIREDSRLPFSYTGFLTEVVAVHQCEGV